MAKGSIYPRTLKDGKTVVYDVRYRTSDGRPRQKRGFRRLGEAERWLNQQMVAVALWAPAPLWAPQPNVTVRSNTQINRVH